MFDIVHNIFFNNKFSPLRHCSNLLCSNITNAIRRNHWSQYRQMQQKKKKITVFNNSKTVVATRVMAQTLFFSQKEISKIITTKIKLLFGTLEPSSQKIVFAGYDYVHILKLQNLKVCIKHAKIDIICIT